MKKLLLTCITLAAITLVALLIYAFTPTSTPKITGEEPTAGDMALIKQGKYLAAAGDCTACHTAQDGPPFAGGLPIASPIGTIYSTNITPDRETGIGDYSLNDFDRALRHGITPSGGTLYPAMPYPSYVRLNDDDVRALYAYFKFNVQPVRAQNHEPDISWPLSMRWPLAIWRKTFAPNPKVTGFDASAYDDPQIARGAYLVQGPGHCGTCHTPRASTLQEITMDEHSKNGALYLSGGQVIDGWLAINLRGDQGNGLGRWSNQDIIDTLHTGRNSHSAVVGSAMGDVVTHSTQHLNESDVKAMAAYLKTLSATNQGATFKADQATESALKKGVNNNRSAELYVDNCAACHMTNGHGQPHAFPAIAGNPTVLADDPITLVRLILAGSAMPSTQQRPSNLGMPGFAWRLDDEEIAQLSTFLRNSWGNHAPAVTTAQVKSVRDSLANQDTPKQDAPQTPAQANTNDH